MALNYLQKAVFSYEGHLCWFVLNGSMKAKNSTNYFLNHKIIPKVIKTDNEMQIEITKQNEILREVKTFYKNLYTVEPR